MNHKPPPQSNLISFLVYEVLINSLKHFSISRKKRVKRAVYLSLSLSLSLSRSGQRYLPLRRKKKTFAKVQKQLIQFWLCFKKIILLKNSLLNSDIYASRRWSTTLSSPLNYRTGSYINVWLDCELTSRSAYSHTHTHTHTYAQTRSQSSERAALS